MDGKTQKERLEQELRFLKESFDAEVISKDEFEKGKERAEKKLKEIENLETYGVKGEFNKEQIKPAELPPLSLSDSETSTGESSSKSFDKSELKEKQNGIELEENNGVEKKTEEEHEEEAVLKKGEEKIELKVFQDEPEEAERFDPVQIKVEHDGEHGIQDKKDEKEQKKESKFFKYALVFIILAILVLLLYSFSRAGTKAQEKISNQTKFLAVCSSDKDCVKEGQEGHCLSPATGQSKCEYKEIPRINVRIINGREECFNCDSQRVQGILENWFGPISAKEIDYGTDEGKSLTEKFNITMLPAYLIDENITRKAEFEQLKQAFVNKSGTYILSEDASGSTFYFKRENIPHKLVLFEIAGDDISIKAEKNLNEFLDVFKEVKFEKHFLNDKLTEELGIKSFPAFLVNNRVRFSGAQSAETIKINFCKLNKLPECGKSLSKSLV